MMSPCAGISASFATCTYASSTIAPFLMICMSHSCADRRGAVHGLFEGRVANTAHDVDEAIFCVVSQAEVAVQHFGQRVDHLLVRQRFAEELAQARVFTGGATEHDLVVLDATFI